MQEEKKATLAAGAIVHGNPPSRQPAKLSAWFQKHASYTGWIYRVYGSEFGLRILNLETRKQRVLTTAKDNLPFYSPDGKRIVFTRRTSYTNFDVVTIRLDGRDPRRLNRQCGMYGFRDECALYDQTFQPYGQIMQMNSDGSNKTLLTDSKWEDSMGLYLPNHGLE
ncbi:hypothetical protein NUU61_009760 [Penicillium alfredii]|uniref:Dipeptidylpeptidase IV N-terminal domain-containing protein n=1 Tax=Penicillium alfredii TaxID=1506179 RepID=A0A9W9JTZ6_9EURO|nr:uncharacterized protein NUU61_009760 [Penicillium alfredii]KAJ5081496.1 hypothetical protein NUU61_009760 [Penicillium alfredii]